MNLYLLEIILKFLRMIFVAIISIFNLNIYAEKEQKIENLITNKNTYAYNTVIIKKPTVSLSNNIKQPVKNNIISSKNNSSKVTNTSKIENTKNETNDKSQTVKNNNISKNGVLATYTGKLTGYGPDCAGCSSKGNVACLTKNKTKHSLITDGIYYEDSEYGKVRILSAATSKFKCGTIIEVTKPGVTPFMAIVLDSGGDMRLAWSKGTVWMDLAYSSNAMSGSDNLLGKNIKFNVQRWGW